MNTLPIFTALMIATGSVSLAQNSDVETIDGVRHIAPETALNDAGLLMQARIIDRGYFSWPAPTVNVLVDSNDRPKSVGECTGHDPAYRPAYDFAASEDRETRKIGQGRAFLHDVMAYRNALATQDCGCAALQSDWNKAVADFNAMIVGVDLVGAYTHVPVRLHSAIRADYKRMCNVTMSLELN